MRYLKWKLELLSDILRFILGKDKDLMNKDKDLIKKILNLNVRLSKYKSIFEKGHIPNCSK